MKIVCKLAGVGSLIFVLGGMAETPRAVSLANPLEVELQGETCEIWDDDQGIPHIHSKNEKEGFACMGFVHARDRAWQMDFFRKTFEGRRAEFFGKDSIQSDFIMRFLNLPEKAQQLFEQMPAKDQEILWAYSYGVNRALRSHANESYEFKDLGYTPDPWKPQDTLSLILLQSFDQTRRTFQTQLNEQEWTKVQGTGAAALFSMDGLPWSTTVLKEGEYPKAKDPASQIQSFYPTESSKSVSLNFPSVFGETGVGSNNWVLATKRSRGGNAWMANDPHLQLTYPPFWEWVHLDAGTIDVIGASLPGIPLIVSGANRHLSWGLTNAFMPAARLSAVPESDLAAAKSYRPLIWVKFWKLQLPFFFKTFRKTASGLRVLPLDPSVSGGAAYSGRAFLLRWSGFDLQAKDLMGLWKLMRASHVKEGDRALAEVGVPSWNFVFADDQGNIGYRTVGRIPRFQKDLVWGIPLQSLDEVEKSKAFTHPLSSDEMPHVINPARGFVATANNPQWPLDSLFNSGRAQYPGFRGFRIEELIQKQGLHDLESQQKIQCDVQAVDARFLLPWLLEVLEKGEESSKHLSEWRQVLDLFKKWDFESSLECRACTPFRLWVEKIDAGLKLNSASLYRRLLAWRRGPDLDTEFTKGVQDAFQETLKELNKEFPQGLPTWGEAHRAFFAHLGMPDYRAVPSIGTPGDDHTVNPGTSDWKKNFFNHTGGASQRLIVEMSQPPKVYSVLAGNNHDTETRSLQDPQSEWQRWVRCQQQRKNFPVDWNSDAVGNSGRVAQW